MDSKIPYRGREFDLLESRYRNDGDWGALAELYRASSGYLADKRMAVQRLLQAGTLLRDKVKNAEGARSCFQQSIDILNGLVTSTRNNLAQSDLLCDLAKIYLEIFQDRDRAIESYVRAFELDPQKTHLMSVIGDIYAQKEGWTDVVARFSFEADSATAPELKAQYLSEVADVYSFILNDPGRAISTYQEILRLDPANRKAMEALESLLVKERRWAELTRFYQDLKGRTTDTDERISLLTKLGLIYKDKLKEPLAAIEVYEEVLAAQPANFRIAAKLEELRGDPEAWSATMESLEAQLRRTKAPSQRIPLLLSQAAIAEKYLGQEELASARLSEALRSDPSHPEALRAAVALWKRAERWSEVAHAYQQAAGKAADPAFRLTALRELAKISTEPLGDPARAISALEAVLEIAPQDAEARDQLIRLYERQRLWAPLEELLDKTARGVEPAARGPILLRLALLREKELSAYDTATLAYEQILSVDAHHPEALAALERLYSAQHRWKDLVGVYERRAELISAPQEKKALYLAQARTLEEKVGDLRAAARAYESALPLSEDPAPVAARIEQIYFREKLWNELADLYDRLLRRAAAPEEQIKLLFKAAELYDQKLSNTARAKACLEAILERRPNDTLALRNLERMAEQSGDWRALIDIYRRETAAAAEVPERISIQLKAAEIFLLRLKDEEQAAGLYRNVLDLDPANRVALDYLADHYRRSHEPGRLLEILQASVRTESEARPLSLLQLEMGRLYEGPLENEGEAVARYEKALELDPSLAEAREALARIYQRRNRWDELIRTYTGELERTPDRLKGSELAAEIGRLYKNRLRDPARSVPYFERSLELTSSNVPVLRDLLESLEAVKAYPKALVYYERLVSLSDDDRECAAACVRTGEIHLEVNGNPETAAQWYERSLSYDPDSPAALGRLTELYESLQNWAGLLRVFEKILPTLSARDAARLNYRMGTLFESRLRANDRALVSFQIASELDPTYVEPVTAMRRLLKAEENWGEYLKLTHAQADLVAEPREKARLFFEAGCLWRERFLQADRAITAFREALRLQPNDAAAMEQLSELYMERRDYDAAMEVTTAALERITDTDRRVPLLARVGAIQVEQKKDFAAAAAVYREILVLDPKNRQALAALVSITRQTSDWKGHLAALQMQLETETTTEGKVEVLLQIAQAWNGPLRSNENATETLNALLRLDPANHPALNLLGEIVSDAGEWNRVSNQILEGLSRGEDPEVQVRAATSVARVHHERFRRTDRAIGVLRGALERTGDRPDLLDGLIGLYEGAGEAVAMADAALRRAQLFASPAERARALLRVAEMWADALENPRQALAALQEARALEPDNPAIVDRLVALQLRTGDWKAASDLIAQTLGKEPLATPRLQELAYQRALLLADRLDAPKEAIELLDAVVAAAPDHAGALDLAVRLYEAAGDWPSVASRLERLAQLAHGAESVELRRRLADLNEHKLKNLEEAVRQYEIILRTMPRDRSSLEAMERLHESRRDYAALAGVLQQQITLTRDHPDAARLYRRLGEVWRDHLKDGERSLAFLERSVEHDPGQADILEHLAERYRALQRPLELSEVLRKQARTASPPAAISVYEELAALWASRLGNPIQAQEFLDEILKIDPDHRPALLKLSELHKQNENYRALAWTLRRLAETAPTPKDKLDHWLELGQVQEEKLASRRDAMEIYRQVLKLDPKQTKALDRLRDLFGRDERWKDLAEVLRTLSKEVGPKDSLAILKQLAQIELERLKNPDQAMATLRLILTLDAGNAEVLHRLQALYEQHGKFKELAEALEEELKGKLPSRRKAAVLRHLGALYDERLRQPDRAIACLERLASDESTDAEVLTRLEALYRKKQRPEDAARVLELRARLLPPGAERTALLESLADHHWTQGRRAPAALRCLALLAEDPAQKKRALERTALIQAETAAHPELSNTLRALVKEAAEPRDRFGWLLKLGRLYDEHLSDVSAAEKAFEEALSLLPHQEEGVEALRLLYVRTKAWKKAAQLLLREAEAVKDVHRKIPLLRELAELYRGPLKDPQKAVALYEELVRVAPHEMEAVTVLAELYFERKLWKEATPLYERLVKVTALRKDGARASKLFFQLGTIVRNLGRNDEAILHFNQALSYDPTHAESIRALAELFYDLKQWDNAIRMLRRAIELGREEDRDYIDRNYYLLIQTLDRLNRQEEAIRIYEEARDALKTHLGAVKLAADLYRRVGRFEEARTASLGVLELAKTAADRHHALYALSELAVAHFHDLPAAREGLTALLREDPNHKKGLELFLLVCEQEKEWPAAIQAIEQLVQLETDSEALSRLHFRLGQIHDRETGDLRRSRECYLKSIEVGTGDAAAMEALQTFCKTEEDWKQLSELYDRKSAALAAKGHADKAANFQLALGHLSRRHLNDREKAMGAYRKALTLDPDSEEAQICLARELIGAPAGAEEAARIFAEILGRAFHRPALLAEIAEFFRRTGKTDRSLVIASIHRTLTESVVPGEGPRVEIALPPPLPEGKPLEPEELLTLYPREIATPWARFFREVSGSLIPLLTAEGRSTAMLSATDVVPEHTTRAVHDIARRLGLEAKRISLYYSAAIPDLELELTTPPALGVGPGFYKLDKGIQTFLLAHRLASVRFGSHLLARIPPARAEELFKALRAAAAEQARPEESLLPMVDALRKGLSRKELKALGAIGARPPAPGELARALEQASLRTAYLLTGDIAASLRGAAHLGADSKSELIKFLLSTAHLEWREQKSR